MSTATSQPVVQAKLYRLGSARAVKSNYASQELRGGRRGGQLALHRSGCLPGRRQLGDFEHVAVAIPKGRDNGLAYVRRLAEDAKFEGPVKRAADKAGLRHRQHGVAV